jgi:hypothetical protein
MTKEDFKDWLEAYGCQFEPIEGFNHTGWSLKITNPKTKRYTYISGPFDQRNCPKFIIKETCLTLGIEQPNYCK